MESPWDGGMKVYSNDPGHMTKMAAMLIYGKKLKKSSSPEPKGQWPWNLVCSIGCLSTTKFVQMMTLSWPWPIYGKVKFGPLCFCMGKRKNNGFFRNYCRLWFETSNRWPKWQEVSVDIKTLSPGDCMPPAQGLYACIKLWKKWHKIRHQRDFFETWTKWVKW